jgi:hypothetical protein
MPTKKGTARTGGLGAAELQTFEQLKLAGRQLNVEQGGRLGWIIRFAQEDPRMWMPSQWETQGYLLLAFAGYGGAFPDGRGWMAPGASSSLPRAQVAAVHAAVGAKLRELVTAPSVMDIEIPLDPQDKPRTYIVRATPPGVKPARFGVGYRGSFITRFWRTLAEEVLRNGDRLLACKHCGVPFLASGKKMFCTPKCAQQWHDGKKVEERRKGGGR